MVESAGALFLAAVVGELHSGGGERGGGGTCHDGGGSPTFSTGCRPAVRTAHILASKRTYTCFTGADQAYGRGGGTPFSTNEKHFSRIVRRSAGITIPLRTHIAKRRATETAKEQRVTSRG